MRTSGYEILSVEIDEAVLRSLPDTLNPKLWFRRESSGEMDFIEERNPHTFPGRMAYYCPHEDRGGNVSASQIAECSLETQAWVSGFLIGNEPAPPDSIHVFADDHPNYQNWIKACDVFRSTGLWPEGAPDAQNPDGFDVDEDDGDPSEAPFFNVYPDGRKRI